MNHRIFVLISLLLSFFYFNTVLYSQNYLREFKIFQFPSDKIPRIDGDETDWQIVPKDYEIGMDEMKMYVLEDTSKRFLANMDNLDVKVKVGWVKDLNRLYFLYKAYDNYWDFSLPGLHNDIFEVVVDGDFSGGPFITNFLKGGSRESLTGFRNFQGLHAQNYHIFTPAVGKEWAYVWGAQQWLKKLPYANAAYNYDFNPGDSGQLTLEFWITLFDHASEDGPDRSVESKLVEGKYIGLSWATLDYDDVNNDRYGGFWTLSDDIRMYGDASYLLPFKLMPLEEKFRKPVEPDWAYLISPVNNRLVKFIDKSLGKISSWQWNFGDGNFSKDKNPEHLYLKPGKYTVILNIKTIDGKSYRMAKIWEIILE